ncbi:hypothetical protein FOMPIDRAFT_82502 [Fomitopsis schrenkii]|uniref:Ig-like domain-containing protein n=1 Tax=Fomitopsis schrenkii TaxID=2126942 RepID=S8EH21_FOMSC|nr:hypothetical protein FOMPIDRAFT_82502 [Fomitopsis schrenkii]
MLLVDTKHLSKALPAVPDPSKARQSIDAPPAYEPVASTSDNPYLRNLVSTPAEVVEDPESYAPVEVTQHVVGDDAEYSSGSESPVTPTFPAPRLRQLRTSESDVFLDAPKPPFQRPTHSDLSLSASSSTPRLSPSHARRRSATDIRKARPYSTVRLPSAPPFDKSEKRSPSKSASGTVTPQDAGTIMAGFLRDLLSRQFAVEQSADVVLKGCADACRVYGLTLATLLQEQSIEGHTPIYWAVVKCSPDPDSTFTHELLDAFLDHAAPLAEPTLSDIRHACLENPDQGLFQWIRRHPAITPLFGASEVLFSGVVPEDDVRVEELPGDNDMFIAHFRVLMFQKRMRVLKHVGLEFIARGRLWSLQVYVATPENARKMRHSAKPGVWVVSLALLEGSQPTWVDSGFIVCKKDGTPTPAEGNRTNWMRLKSTNQLSAPPRHSTISASFKEAFSLECLSANSPYVRPDGSLEIRLEASLKQRETGCIIC